MNTDETKKPKRVRKSAVKKPEVKAESVADLKVADAELKQVVSVFKVSTNLEPSDLLRIEMLGEGVKITKLEMALEEQALRNLMLLKENIEMQIDKQKRVVFSKHEAYNNKSKERTQFVKEISPKYGAKDGDNFGYNPDTGEIILNTK